MGCGLENVRIFVSMNLATRLLIFFILIFSGCEKDDDSGNIVGAPPTSSSSWSFSAVVNGNFVQADSARGYLHIDTSLGLPHRVFILMAYCDTQAIIPGFSDFRNTTQLAVYSYDSVNFADTTMAHLQYMTMNDTINDYMQTGAQHFDLSWVDNTNRKISGHFNGTVVADVTGDTIVITNGVFNNIPYEIW
jgi:hypothetical protein